MGVTVLQQFPIVENRTGPSTIELLTKRISALGATQQGQFLVDCETFTSVPQLGNQRTVHVLHNSEQPATVFSILETGTKTIPLVTDGLFDLLMMKMSNFYNSKKQTKAESKGPRYEIGDFCVKLGTVTVSQNFKGVLVEVEYRPCVVPAMCWELMREFLQGFLGSPVLNTPPEYLQKRMQDVYTPIDTIHQYLEHFTMYRKSTGMRT